VLLGGLLLLLHLLLLLLRRRCRRLLGCPRLLALWAHSCCLLLAHPAAVRECVDVLVSWRIGVDQQVWRAGRYGAQAEADMAPGR